MPPDQIFVCILVLLTVAMFVWEKFAPDVVSMGALFLLLVVPFNGHPILSPSDKATQTAILGNIFGNNAILTVAFMFIVGAAVERTGLAEAFGHWFERIAGSGGRRTVLMLGLLAIPISAFLNNTTVVVVFIPMVLGLCRRKQLIPSHYLIPLSYFAIAGGMCTIIGTSTNLVVNGIVKQKGLHAFQMFDIAPLGITLSLGILVFMVLFGRRMLPERPSLAVLIDSESSHEFLIAAIIGQDSQLVNATLGKSPLGAMKRLRLIEVRRSGNRVETPLNELQFEAGDRVILKCHCSSDQSKAEIEAKVKADLGLTYVHTEPAVLMEGMIGPHSTLVGKSLVDINFRQHFGVLIVALHREGENQRDKFERIKLEVGDTLLLEGSKERMTELFASGDFINLSEVKPKTKPQPSMPGYRASRSWVALTALAAVVVLGSIDFIPFEWVALGAALLVTLGGCLKRDEIYAAVDWPIIIMILGTLGLGVAMDKTGAAKTIVHYLMEVVGTWDKSLIVSAVLLLSIVLTELLSNNAVAALLTPLAIQLGADLGCDPRPFIVAVMAGASIGFAIPAGYQTHMLVYSAGGYKFSDFFRIGLVMDLICWVLGSIAIPLIWPV
ncbi:MAG: SLC13 family permease [Verrucomicrobiaceae bacterium]|nr:SLC13 family permease [Verrucomicrobiaceae bacterium]